MITSSKQYPAVNLQIKRHDIVCGDKNRFCAHPLWAGPMFNFGNGEVAFYHMHANCDYINPDSADHARIYYGDQSENQLKMLLMRSYDGGVTWDPNETKVVWDFGISVEEQRTFINDNKVKPDEIPPVTKETIFRSFFPFCGEEKIDSEYVAYLERTYIARSDDKGRTWKCFSEPTKSFPFFTMHMPVDFIRQADGYMMKTATVSVNPNGAIGDRGDFFTALYASEDNGYTWTYISTIARDFNNETMYAYSGLTDFGKGKLVHTCSPIGQYSLTRWISVSFSEDNGMTWTEPRRISRGWDTSPCPLKLNDGRFIIIFAKRVGKKGMYVLVSEDQGHTWSDELCLRNDATRISHVDIGYPVATQLDNGDILTCYYYMSEESGFGANRRYIASTTFSV